METAEEKANLSGPDSDFLLSIFPLGEAASRLTCAALTDVHGFTFGERVCATVEELKAALEVALNQELTEELLQTRQARETSQISISFEAALALHLEKKA